MLVGGVLLPHPPIVLPSHARRRGRQAEGTVRALRAACRWVAEELRPDRLVVASPHPGHGFQVPLAFLEEAMGRLPRVTPLLTTHVASERYRELGRSLRADAAAAAERVAVVGSGDCSHRLEAGGPYGFHPYGAVLDRWIREAVSRGSAEELLTIDPEVVREGAECGLRSFVYALSALEPVRCRILSYEAPYGVGYLVATLEPEDPASA